MNNIHSMMKLTSFIHLLIVTALLSVSVAQARNRSTDEILQAASNALFQCRLKKKAPAIQVHGLTVLRQNQQLTLVGGSQGFAVIANDDAINPVIAVSPDSYQIDNKGVQWYLETAEKALKNYSQTGRQYAPVIPQGPFQKNVPELLTTLWEQGTPYNDLCPQNKNGGHYPTGCVSTAMSQIMYYHKYPIQGQGSRTYSFQADDRVGDLISVDFGATTYDWEHMLPVYGINESQQAKTAVATLMFHAGVAVEMTYNTNGSGAYPSEARYGLIQYFRYNPNTELLYRDYYSVEEWMRIVYTELNAKRPILYGGSDKRSGGHAFVIDGYDENGLVHVNWGWGADGGNGYYDIALLNVESHEFSLSQHMLVNLCPEEIGEFKTHLVSDKDMEARHISKTRLSVPKDSEVGNVTGEILDGEMAVILEPVALVGDGWQPCGEQMILASSTFEDMGDYSYVTSPGGLVTLPTSIIDGTYRLYVAAKSPKDNAWRLVRRPEGKINSYLLTYADGDYSLEPVTDDLWSSALTTNLEKVVMGSQNRETKVCDAFGRCIYRGPTATFKVRDIPAKGLLLIQSGQAVLKVVK